MKKNNQAIVCLIMLLFMAGCGEKTYTETPEKNNGNKNIEETGQSPQMASTLTEQKVEKEEDIPTFDAKEEENTAPVTEEADDDKENESVKVIMVGDILLHTRVEDAARDDSCKYDFNFIFENMKDDISEADIAIANQEVIIGGEELGISGYPSFNAPYEIGDALVKTGFDIICHATNHALDKGKKGVVNAHDYWDDKHPEITVLGINEDENEYNTVKIVEKNGIKIAFLNYTYGTNGIQIPSEMPYAVDKLEEEKVSEDLKYAEENADFTIVCPHWGTEYRLEPDDYQKKWRDFFRENGADLVIGTHPHVIEPIEFLDDELDGNSNNHGNGDMLVYYSLGNFVNWTSGTGSGVANRMVGGMAEISIEKINGEAVIKDYGIKAIVCHVKSGYEGVSVYSLKDYSEKLALENEIINQDPAFSKEYCEKLCNEVWGDIWE